VSPGTGLPVQANHASGPTLFARYAYAPNERGYCGPADHVSLLEYGAARVVDPGLTDLARGFNGAWPYLSLIAQATGVGDPLDRRVVEAYWLGTSLLDRIDMAVFGNALEDRFRHRTGASWQFLAESVPAGSQPSHSFHVFEVYPWTGLLESYRGGHPLHILDRCRIRWGQVVSSSGDQAVVRSQLLAWDGHRLTLGAPEVETVRRSVDGVGFVGALEPGQWVSLHWDWVCDRLTPEQLAALQRSTVKQLAITNRTAGHPGPAMTLG
jgi:hypothetical protein